MLEIVRKHVANETENIVLQQEGTTQPLFVLNVTIFQKNAVNAGEECSFRGKQE